ncbi:MAG TPA: hypothetical protein VFT22_42960 [Kofleriaceae bacterium]|nr:hypothetical protein [Kofleriaceae bacterium]
MKKTLLAAMFIFASVGTASAGGLPNTIGVGAEIQLSNIGGVSVNYDAGKFHVGGFVGFNDPDGGSNETINLGGRFFYHVASTAMSDFSIGGGLGLQSQDNPAPVGRQTLLFLEPGFQIRAFIASNVALSFTGGISIGTADASQVVITGDVTGTAGVHYYF